MSLRQLAMSGIATSVAKEYPVHSYFWVKVEATNEPESVELVFLWNGEFFYAQEEYEHEAFSDDMKAYVNPEMSLNLPGDVNVTKDRKVILFSAKSLEEVFQGEMLEWMKTHCYVISCV
jgi:hypothetical protein